jgi:hypothetical protein
LARSALQLFRVIPDPKAIGTVHLRLARPAATPEEAAEHREAARKAWASIDPAGVHRTASRRRRVTAPWGAFVADY